MCKIVFGVLCIMCVLAAAKRTANAVVQLCKLVNRPSKCVLTFGRNCKGKGHHVMSRVWTYPVLCRVR